jgi:regulator of replication initiation timing
MLTSEREKELRDHSLKKCGKDHDWADSTIQELLAEIDALRAESEWRHEAEKNYAEALGECRSDLERRTKERDQLKAENEKLRMQLAGCGVAAMCNTKESANKQRIGKENPYYSASYQDVCDAVDREMKLRERIANLREGLTVITTNGLTRGMGWTASQHSRIVLAQDDEMEKKG